jgi:hypothetical protein
MYSADDLFIDLFLNATASGMPDDPAYVPYSFSVAIFDVTAYEPPLERQATIICLLSFKADVICLVMLSLGVFLPAPAQPSFKKNCKVRRVLLPNNFQMAVDGALMRTMAFFKTEFSATVN